MEAVKECLPRVNVLLFDEVNSGLKPRPQALLFRPWEVQKALHDRLIQDARHAAWEKKKGRKSEA